MDDTKSVEKPMEGMRRKEDGTVELTIIIPWHEAEKAKIGIEEELIKSVELPGFRKGQAPSHLAKAKLSPDLVKEEVLKKVVGKAYNDAIVKNNLRPIISPRVHIEVFEDGTDIVFMAETAEEPAITLGNYKAEIQKVTAKSKIVTPGNPSTHSTAAQGGEQSRTTGSGPDGKPTIDQIVEAAMAQVSVKIPDVLVESEVSRLLSQLLDELKQLGLTLEQYLGTRQKNPEQLREEYKEKAERDLKLEFFLRKVADEEKISVEKEDVEKAMATIEDEKQRKDLLQNPYLVAGIIRQQKTLDFLTKI